MDDNDNWYSKLAKAGYLGTKAQVSAQYGNPAWKSSDSTDAYAEALKKKAKAQPQDESAGS